MWKSNKAKIESFRLKTIGVLQIIRKCLNLKNKELKQYHFRLQEEDHHNNEIGVNPTMTGQESPNSNVVVESGSAYTTVEAAQTILFVDDPVSPGISSWLGAEVQVENKIARRCSYEEMVHEEYEDIPLPPACGSEQVLDHWYASVTRVTQWAITLQEVADERKNSPNLSSKCLCHKAAAIVQKLQNLMQFLICPIEEHHSSATAQDDLIFCVDDVQSALRAGVSIQVILQYFFYGL